MVERKQEDSLLVALLLLLIAREDEDPYSYDLLRRLQLRGTLGEFVDPEVEYLLERALRRPRPRRSEETREIAVSVLEGFRHAFQERVENQIRSIEERLQTAEMSQDKLQEAVNRQAIEQSATAYGLHEFISLLSAGGEIGSARTTRYIPLRLFLGDPVPDESIRQKIVAAVEELLKPLGFERSNELPEESGSWWKRLLLRTKGMLTHDEVQKRLRTAEQALEATYLDKPQAEANHLQAGAAAQLITALATTPNACIQVGSLLLVKGTRPDGQCAVVVRTLTTDELRSIEENQAILKRPEEVLEWLQGCATRKLDDPGA